MKQVSTLAALRSIVTPSAVKLVGSNFDPVPKLTSDLMVSPFWSLISILVGPSSTVQATWPVTVTSLSGIKTTLVTAPLVSMRNGESRSWSIRSSCNVACTAVALSAGKNAKIPATIIMIPKMLGITNLFV